MLGPNWSYSWFNLQCVGVCCRFPNGRQSSVEKSLCSLCPELNSVELKEGGGVSLC